MNESDSAIHTWFGMSRETLVHALRCLADDLENVSNNLEALPTVAINSWALSQRSVPCLMGRTLGHPAIGDGRPALSSELFYLDPERGVARTLSRWYRLGTRVDPGYWNERYPRRP